MNSTIIEIAALKKWFGDTKAVDGITLQISKGEMFGLVGPDGAGKTTTIRTLCGLMTPTEGTARLFDLDVVTDKRKIQNRVGYLSQKFSLYGDLSIDENIEFFADVHGVPNYKKRRDLLLEFTRLTPFRDRAAEKLSGGMKQKLALACSLIHTPEILFLDEPTTGVDPVSRRDFWKILSDLLRQGITILMSTPYLDEAERCSTVALMHLGKIIALGKPKELKARSGINIVELTADSLREIREKIEQQTSYTVQLFGDRINIVIPRADADEASFAIKMKELDISYSSIRIISPSLENVFIYSVQQQSGAIK